MDRSSGEDDVRNKRMNKTLKRVIAGITGTAVVCGAIVGGLYAYKGMNRVSVKVYPVNTIAQDSYYFDMFGSGTGYGTVEADQMQNVTPSSTMQVVSSAANLYAIAQRGNFSV